MRIDRLALGWFLSSVLVSVSVVAGSGLEAGAIRPSPDNPWYWEYQGKTTILIGGSDDDNLFQHPQLKEQLDRLKAAGGNYIRNTMSDRRDGGWEVYPYRKLADGKYDLNQWNREYWDRFERMLQWTSQRGIVVQIEVWDRFDYTDQRKPHWKRHPYNPVNNVNYTAAEAKLRATYRKHPGTNEQPFFHTVPGLQNNSVLLKYQIARVDKMLSYSLKYPNVLYCMDNETSGDPKWGAFWAAHIHRRAKESGRHVYVTEMWDAWDLRSPQHAATFDHPELYDFVDISQNNHNRGDRHWDGLQFLRRRLAKRPRPMNAVKIYGADTGRYGTSQDGKERFWRLVLGGAASARFHRPASGLGLSDEAVAHLRAMRAVMERVDLTRGRADARHALLGERAAGEAFLRYRAGSWYVVYFPRGGAVRLDLTSASGRFRQDWLEIEAGRWSRGAEIAAGGQAALAAPGKGHSVVVLRRAD